MLVVKRLRDSAARARCLPSCIPSVVPWGKGTRCSGGGGTDEKGLCWCGIHKLSGGKLWGIQLLHSPCRCSSTLAVALCRTAETG